MLKLLRWMLLLRLTAVNIGAIGASLWSRSII
jgi:hypothetical protein